MISEVVYDPNHLIFRATRHQETEKGIDVGTVVDRLTISSDIANGKSYITIYNSSASWKKGHKIQTFRIKGEPYIRIDNNKVGLDFLGDIPELQGYESEKTTEESKELPTQTEEPAPKPEEPAPKPEEPAPESPRGSLPKDTEVELPQELELLPEDESDPAPKPEDKSTPEQPTQLDDLKSQLVDLENSLTGIKLIAKVSKQKIKEPSSDPQPTQLGGLNSETNKPKDSAKENDSRRKRRQKPKTTKSKKKKKISRS